MKIFQIRPKTLKEFQGKKSIKKNLEIYINGALKRNDVLDHCLLYGPPGVGKTSLANIIANELKQKIRIIQGPEIQDKNDIINILYSLGDKNILFIDEIHSINPKCFEILYSAMEDFKINVEIGKDFNKKITSINVPKFTLVGATTKIGNLPNPFEERFGILINVLEYENHEIEKILKYTLKMYEKNLSINEDIIKFIASRSKGVPRVAKRLLSRYLDHIDNHDKKISEIFESIGIYENGLEDLDIRYLQILKENKKLGLKTICQLLNVDEKTLLDKIEPFLIKNMYINKTSSGRILTNKGTEFLKKI